jgi:hypothetical protein
MIDPPDHTVKTATVWLAGGELTCTAGARSGYLSHKIVMGCALANARFARGVCTVGLRHIAIFGCSAKIDRNRGNADFASGSAANDL